MGKSQEQKVMLHLYLAGFVLGSLLLVFLGHVALQESEGRRLVTGAVLKLVTPVFVFGAEVVGFIGAGWVVVPLLLIAWSACPTRLSQPVAKGWMLMVGMVVSMYTMYAKFVTQPWFMGLILFLFVSLVVIVIVLELSIKFRLEYAGAVVQECAHGTHDPIKGPQAPRTRAAVAVLKWGVSMSLLFAVGAASAWGIGIGIGIILIWLSDHGTDIGWLIGFPNASVSSIMPKPDPNSDPGPQPDVFLVVLVTLALIMIICLTSGVHESFQKY